MSCCIAPPTVYDLSDVVPAFVGLPWPGIALDFTNLTLPDGITPYLQNGETLRADVRLTDGQAVVFSLIVERSASIVELRYDGAIPTLASGIYHFDPILIGADGSEQSIGVRFLLPIGLSSTR